MKMEAEIRIMCLKAAGQQGLSARNRCLKEARRNLL
jgi:hypothetical protein